jgi:hypothetical protein
MSDQPQRKTPICPQGNLFQTDTRNQAWTLIAPPGTNPADLVDSDFYFSVAGNLRQWDSIKVIADDGSFYSEVLVLAKGTSFVRAKVLSFANLQPTLEDVANDKPPVGFDVSFSQLSGWQAHRQRDGVCLVSNALSRAECLTQLRDHATLR